jgi:hypothetical protein
MSHDADDRTRIVHPTEPPFDEEIHVRAIASFVVGLVLVLVFVSVLMLLYVKSFRAHEARLDVPPSPFVDVAHRRQPPLPHLQVTPEKDLAAMRAAEDSVLHGYGWTDPKSGLAHIPIERAMQLVAQRGLPPVGTGTSIGAAPAAANSGVVPSQPTPRARRRAAGATSKQ